MEWQEKYSKNFQIIGSDLLSLGIFQNIKEKVYKTFYTKLIMGNQLFFFFNIRHFKSIDKLMIIDNTKMDLKSKTDDFLIEIKADEVELRDDRIN